MDNKKATIAIGGAQGVQMMSNFIRAKIISVVLGPAGFGIYSVVMVTIMTINQFVNCGVNQAVIKDLSEAGAKNDTENTHRLEQFFLSFSKIAALGGMLLMAALSALLSFLFLNSTKETWIFVVGSIALCAYSFSQSFFALLQANRRLKKYAKISIISSIITLAISSVFIYYLKIVGLVFSIVIGFTVTAIMAYRSLDIKLSIFSNPFKYANFKSPIIHRGFFIMLGTFCISLFTMLLNMIISHDGIEIVGLYQAAISIMSQGLTIISLVLAAEFYPRISTIENNVTLNNVIEDEINLLFSLTFPLGLSIMLLSPLVVKILYADSFIIVPSVLRIMSLTLMFRVVWMICGFTILSRGEKYSYFLFDGFLGNLLNFLTALIGYKYNGLIGLAWGWALGNVIVAMLLAVVVKVRYQIHISNRIALKLILSTVFMLLVLFGIYKDILLIKIVAALVAIISMTLAFRNQNSLFKK